MRLSGESNALAGRMAAQRQKDLEKQKKRILEHPLKFDCIRGGKLYARDDSGRRVDLKVELKDWKVIIGLRREDVGKMGPDFVEGAPIPRETVYTITDVYHGVRLLKHIPEEHDAEIAGMLEMLGRVDLPHAESYLEGSRLGASELEDIRRELAAPLEEVAKKNGGYKKLSEFKLDKALELLDKAGNESDLFKKRGLITPACASLVAFKNRYGGWRHRQIGRIDRYEAAREDGLRRVRNSRMRGLLIELADRLERRDALGIACTMARDWEMIRRMGEAQEKITRAGFEEALVIIKDCGTSVKAEWVKEKLRAIYDFVRRSMKTKPNGWRTEARGMLEDFARFMGQRNTKYIAAELNETGDVELADFVKSLEAGNAKMDRSLEESAFWNKKKRLGEAARLYGKAVAALAAAYPDESP